MYPVTLLGNVFAAQTHSAGKINPGPCTGSFPLSRRALRKILLEKIQLRKSIGTDCSGMWCGHHPWKKGTWRCVSEGHGQWTRWDGQGLGLVILVVSSSLNGSMILFRDVVSGHGGVGLGLDFVILVVFSNLNYSDSVIVLRPYFGEELEQTSIPASVKDAYG